MRVSTRPLAAAAVLLLAGCGQLPGGIESPASGPGLEVQSRSSDYQRRAGTTVTVVTIQVGNDDTAIIQAGSGNTGIIQGNGVAQVAQVGDVNSAAIAQGAIAGPVLQSSTQALISGGGWGGGQFAQVSQPIQQVGSGPQLAAPQAGIQQVNGGKSRFSQRSRSRQL